MREYFTQSPDETVKLGHRIGGTLGAGTVVAFFGDLGAGKTQFVKGLVEAVTESTENRVTSPTFIYLNIYEGKTSVHHFDLYRLSDSEQFLSMGFDEYLNDNAITCIEWAENIADILPKDVCRCTIEHIGQEGRKVIWEEAG